MNNSGNAWTVSKAMRWAPAVFALIAVAVLFAQVFGGYWKEWNRSNGYYSHGILVPVIALYMVWANRKRLSAHRAKPAWYGGLLIVPAIPLYLFGKWTGSGALLDASLMLTVVGSVWSFAGSRITRILLFPILYLVFMVPLPGTVLDEATMRIQLQSTRVAAVILNVTGYTSELVGSNEIHSSYLPEPLIVGVACSGFKLLISLMTFTAFFVYMIQAPWWKKAVLVAFAVPLSVFVNSLRIAMIGYAGIWTGTADAMHDFHDWSGYLGLVICFVILFGFARLIKASRFGVEDGGIPAASDAGAPPQYKWRGLALPVVALALMLALGVLITPLESTAKGVLVRENITKGYGDWTSRDLTIAENVVKELKSADLLSRLYTNIDDGRQVELFMEVARDTDAFHNPMMCIPGSGSGITNTETVDIDIAKPRKMRVRASLLKVSTLDGDEGYIIHWYMIGQDTFRTTSDIRRHMRILQIRDMYHTMTRFSERDELRRKMSERQTYWYRFYSSAFDTEQTDIAFLKQFIVGVLERNQGFGRN